MRAIDPPGTCHLVMCPGKGQHAPHPGPMAAPSAESFRRQATAVMGPSKVLLDASLVERMRVLLGVAGFVSASQLQERELLMDEIRKATR